MADLDTKPHAETGLLALDAGPDEAEAALVAARGAAEPAGLAEQALYRRAVEAAIWGAPLVTFHAFRQAYFSDAGARLNDVIFWPEPARWTFQAPTPDPAARHLLFFLSVEDGPMVVEIPPAGKAELAGTLVDSWNVPIADVGPTGADKGKGAKYLLIPPEQETRHALGFLPLKSATRNVCGWLQLTPRSDGDEDLDDAIAYLKLIKIYPLSGGGPMRRQRFIDMAHRRFEGTISWDSSFFAALAKMVAEEPTRAHDQALMGLLRTIGIGRQRAFQPDGDAESILERAVAEAHLFMAEGRRKSGSPAWPGRRWMLRETVGSAFAGDELLMVDERAFASLRSFGARRLESGERHFEAILDERGDPLDGSRAYRLGIPAGLAGSAWSVAAYDAETNAFIRESPSVGFASGDRALERSEDGSVDLHLAPRPPRSRGSNWIATAQGRPFFLVFRLRSGAQAGAHPLDDVEPIA